MASKCSSMICFLRDSLQRPHMKEIVADRMSGSRVIPKLVVGGRNISVQTFASIPHASSKSWGTYLVSLCFCAHSLSGIELRYSFSDSFNLRTISSNEVGVTGMAPIGLSQFELPLIRNFAAPYKHPKLLRDVYKRTKVTSRSTSDR
jgi:hypothetical protein